MRNAAIRWISIRWMLMTVAMLAVIGMLPLKSVPNAFASSPTQQGKWRTFNNRAGWRISYPRQWRIGSCHQCSDPTDPKVFVTFSDPSTKTFIMIEHLIDKPAREHDDSWLKEVSRDSILNPPIREEWIVLDHRKALRVITKNPDSTTSENIYILNGQKTFAIRSSRTTLSDSTYRRILSTFKFVAVRKGNSHP